MILLEAEYSLSEVSVGFAIPNPPNLTGRESICLFKSETLCPINVSLMASSSGAKMGAYVGDSTLNIGPSMGDIYGVGR